MNAKIIQFLRNTIKSKGIKYSFVAEKTGIDYQRLMRLFNQNATISGSELICICRVLEVEQSALMTLIDPVA